MKKLLLLLILFSCSEYYPQYDADVKALYIKKCERCSFEEIKKPTDQQKKIQASILRFKNKQLSKN